MLESCGSSIFPYSGLVTDSETVTRGYLDNVHERYVHVHMCVYMYMIIVSSSLVDLLCSEAGDWELSENTRQHQLRERLMCLWFRIVLNLSSINFVLFCAVKIEIS